jgi:MoaA/NifB/PqqE/SkfB family radical SAM enzyme
VPDTICLLPWLNLSLDVDGSSRPCCKFDHATEVGGKPLLNLQQSSLAEVWDSPGLVELRRSFRRGDQPAGCASCWAEEAAGVPSFRQTYLHDRAISAEVDVDDPHPAQPAGLDLKLSNTCNLACRMCGPVASSRWLTEELSAEERTVSEGFVTFLADKRRYLADQKILGDPEGRAQLEHWAPQIEHLELTGGEPMLSKESADVLELLVSHGDPSRTTIQITTNATVINDRILQHLGRFRRASISLSVDDMGPRLEYQRDPAVWAEVEQNIARYAAMAGPSWELYLNATVNTLNVWDFPDYVAWWDRTYPGNDLQFALNFVHHPEELSIQQLPEAVKEAVAAHWDRHPARHAARVAPLLDRVLGFAGARRSEPVHWGAFLEHTAALDRRRGQRLADVYPEFVAALATTGSWPEAPP